MIFLCFVVSAPLGANSIPTPPSLTKCHGWSECTGPRFLTGAALPTKRGGPKREMLQKISFLNILALLIIQHSLLVQVFLRKGQARHWPYPSGESFSLVQGHGWTWVLHRLARQVQPGWGCTSGVFLLHVPILVLFDGQIIWKILR